MIKKRDVCGIGLSTTSCAAEFRKLQLINAVEVDPEALKPRRVNKDLLALYMFNEGKGTVVRDVSGVGKPLDLTIGSPDQVQWYPHFIRVRGPADIGHSGEMKRLCEAWKKNNALTFEIWSRSRLSSTAVQTGARRFFRLGAADRPGFWMMSPHFGGQLSHGACILSDIKGRLAMALYHNGAFGGINPTVGAPLELHKRKKPIDIRMVSVENFAATAQNVWTGDIVMVAVYGRALSRNEVAQNFKAGVPLEHGFFPKYVRHYEQQGFVLETQAFREGAVLASHTAANLKDVFAKEKAIVKLGSVERGGRTIDVLNVSNAAKKDKRLLLPLPYPLPRAFAVESEWRIQKNLGGAAFGVNLQNLLDYQPNPVPNTVKHVRRQKPSWQVGQWTRYRQEFLLVGRLHDRSPIYEVRDSWGPDTGSTCWVTFQGEDMILSVRGASVQLKSVDIVELLPTPEPPTVATGE